MKPERFCFAVLAAAVSASCTGCFFGKPKRVAAPAWDPEQITKGCMAQVDTDKDGFLSTDELKQTPGLQSCAKELDTDGDNRLSRDEVLARFKLYQDTGAGLVGLNCRVLVNGQPAQDAEVQLVPEDFLKDYVPTASGRASDGSVSIISPNPEGLPLAREGMYRVEITSPSLRIPAKYNTETSFGIEVLASSYATQGREFKVTTR